MAWKQPISTEILNSEVYDIYDRLMFMEICINIRNTDHKTKPFVHGNKVFEVELKRGEAIFSVKKFSQAIGINHKLGTQKLNKLNSILLKAELKRKSYGFIVSLKNPDEFFQMELKRNSIGTQKELKGNAYIRNKNEKSVKNEKKDTDTMVKTPTAFMTESDFEDFWKEYPRKEKKALARTKFLSLKEKLLPQIMGRLEDFKKSEDWMKNNGRFIPHPITWLNQKRFEDEVIKKEPEGRNFNFVN